MSFETLRVEIRGKFPLVVSFKTSTFGQETNVDLIQGKLGKMAAMQGIT